MGLVLRHGALGQVEHPPEGVPDPVGHGQVVGSAVPDGQDVLLKTSDVTRR